MNAPTTAARTQTFENHRAKAPVYILAGAVLGGDVGFRLVEFAEDQRIGPLWHVLAAAALVVVWRVSRGSAQRVQDRLIRLEMRLRLERVLPAAQRSDIDRLALGQLISLRFASDAELPALVKTVLDENITNRSDIKRRIQDWQADWLRA